MNVFETTKRFDLLAEPHPKVSILVISYNTREMTLECLRSIAKQTEIPHEVIVLDNLSSDGSSEAIAREFPEVRLLDESENHGFAKGNNIAADVANGKYLLLLNPDTVVLDQAVDRLVAFAEENPSSRIWGGRTLFADGSLNSTSCWRRMSLWTIFCRTSGLTGIFSKSEVFNPEAYGGWRRDSERQVDIVTGCFLLIKRKDWQDLAGFDETFYMYGEETDLCMRATRDFKAAPQITPDATIIHYGGASEKVRADRVVRVLRAKGEILKRYLPAWQRPVGKVLFTLFPYSRWRAAQLLGLGGARGENAEVWKEVWVRRNEWKDGFLVA